MRKDGAAAGTPANVSSHFGVGKLTAGEHRSRPESSALGGGVRRGVRSDEGQRHGGPFITASYVMCQHLSAFSQRLNSAVAACTTPTANPHLSLLSAHARTRRLPVFCQAGGAAAVRSGVICTEWSGLLRNRWLSDHGHCGDVRQGDGEGSGRSGGGIRSPAKVGHPNHSWCFLTKWCLGVTGHARIFSENAKWKWIRVVRSLFWLEVRIHSYGNCQCGSRL